MVGLNVLLAELSAGAAGLLVYLVTYLWQGRGVWYRNIYGVGQVLLAVVGLAWYSKATYSPIHNFSFSSAVYYGAFAVVFWMLAIGAVWVASGGAARSRQRKAARRAVSAADRPSA